jgi:hypothetical protein
MDLEELMVRVARGETEFQAGGDTPEAGQDFLRTVDAACQAFMRGYVASLDTRWRDGTGRRSTDAILVRELTGLGHRFVEKLRTNGPMRA